MAKNPSMLEYPYLTAFSCYRWPPLLEHPTAPVRPGGTGRPLSYPGASTSGSATSLSPGPGWTSMKDEDSGESEVEVEVDELAGDDDEMDVEPEFEHEGGAVETAHVQSRGADIQDAVRRHSF